MKRRALITGITGQDGSYLAEWLLEKDYEVYGMIRRKAVQQEELGNAVHLENEIEFDYGDVTDSASVQALIRRATPHEVYNLAGQSQVRVSFAIPHYTMQVNAMGALNVLEACREWNKVNSPVIRLYQASTSEMFGRECNEYGEQDETTAMVPISPYGAAKLFAHHLVRNYRESFGQFACSGILFNHESPRRGEAFVTQKVITSAVEIMFGVRDVLELGNFKVSRDWGHAKDYVRAMWLMLQQSNPDDFVIATGISHSLMELVEHVFERCKLDVNKHLRQNQKFFRPNEVLTLKGNPTKAMAELKWSPMYTFQEMVDEMLLSAKDKIEKKLEHKEITKEDWVPERRN